MENHENLSQDELRENLHKLYSLLSSRQKKCYDYKADFARVTSRDIEEYIIRRVKILEEEIERTRVIIRAYNDVLRGD